MNSMTGYGRANIETNNRCYKVEIKSVNHKYNALTIKMPKDISYLEEKVKKYVQANISRGKIDIYIEFENNSAQGKNIKINSELAKIYIGELKKLAKENNIKDDIQVMDISKLPDVLTVENNEDETLIWEELSICLKNAIDQFVMMRKEEGTRIKEDFEKRIEEVSKDVEKISKYSTRLVEEYIVKLRTRIKELLNTDIVNEDRLEQEIVIYSDKCSIEEELTRLKSHISQFKKLITEDEPVGKKLDFLMQEMNRETNTIGSKANNLEITNLVIQIKTILEDIREQIQNIE